MKGRGLPSLFCEWWVNPRIVLFGTDLSWSFGGFLLFVISTPCTSLGWTDRVPLVLTILVLLILCLFFIILLHL